MDILSKITSIIIAFLATTGGILIFITRVLSTIHLFFDKDYLPQQLMRKISYLGVGFICAAILMIFVASLFIIF